VIEVLIVLFSEYIEWGTGYNYTSLNLLLYLSNELMSADHCSVWCIVKSRLYHNYVGDVLSQ